MEIAEITTQPKRLRQDYKGSSSNPNDNLLDEDSSVKRLKPYNSILNLLDEDDDDDGEQEPSDQDLSAMFKTLQRELSSPSLDDDHKQPQSIAPEPYDGSSAATSADEGDENVVRSLMRDLLEASDDELGIPSYIIDHNDNGNNNIISNNYDNQSSEENMVPFGFSGDQDHVHGFWELEDEAANYYTVLQSELLM